MDGEQLSERNRLKDKSQKMYESPIFDLKLQIVDSPDLSQQIRCINENKSG